MTWARPSAAARRLSEAVVLFAAYVATARLGLMLHPVGGFATLVWPPTGIALFALVRYGRSLWPAIFLGSLLTNLLEGAPLTAGIGMAAGNTLEAVIGASLLKLAGVELSLGRVKDVLALVALAAIGSTWVSASAGVGSLWAAGAVSKSALPETFRAWWLGDMLGDLVVAPALMVWSKSTRAPTRQNVVEALWLLGALALSSAFVFGNMVDPQSRFGDLYLLFPVLIWAALRFAQWGAVTATMFVSAVGIAGTVLGRGPFIRETVTGSLLSLQTFVAISATTELVLAAAVAERNRAAKAAERSGRVARFLARVGDVLASSLDLEVTLRNVVRLAVPTIAESCVVSVTDIDGKIRRAFETTWPAADQEALLRFEQQQSVSDEGAGPRSDGVHLSIALVARNERIGMITLGRAVSRRRYTPEDAALAGELGQRAAMAVDNARLYREAEVERSRAERAEVEMRSERQQARTIAEAIPQLVWAALPDGTTDYVNTRWREYTGMEPDISGTAWRKIVHPDEEESVVQRWSRSLATGEPFEMEIRLLRAMDRRYRSMLVRAVPLRDRAGRITRWLGTCTDIEEQKRLRDDTHFLAQASALLAESLDYQRTLAKLADVIVPRLADWCTIHLEEEEGMTPKLLAVAHADSERVKWAQELAAKWIPDPDAPRGVFHVVRTGRSELYSEIDEQLLQATAQNAEHLDVLRAFRLRSVMIVPLQARGRTFGAITFISAESGRRYSEADLAVARSLADRAAYAVDNARLFAEAQQAIRVREEFLSIASHELRTPLTALELQVASLRRTAEKSADIPADKLRPKMDTIQRQLDRLTKLIENLLDVSRIMAGRFAVQLEPVDFAEVTDDVCRRFREQLVKAGCELDLDVEAPCIGLWDRLRLDQVLTNLLSNAIKYGHGKPIEVGLHSDGQDATLSVRDHGIGVSPEDQGRIFERFERAVSQRHFGGLGLGLWIVRQIVTALSGRIAVESSPGAGATFTVTLPRKPPADFDEASARAEPVSSAAPLH